MKIYILRESGALRDLCSLPGNFNSEFSFMVLEVQNVLNFIEIPFILYLGLSGLPSVINLLTGSHQRPFRTSLFLRDHFTFLIKLRHSYAI